jgi:AcrR family transcriptional regulator
MSSPSSPPAGSAAEKLLDAAIVVFSRSGIGSATTREIAKEAGVNEVTLFRNFQNKQGLLSAVLERAFLPSVEQRSLPGKTVGTGASLEDVLMEFAAVDFERKQRNIALMRVLLGEVHCLGDQETEVLRRIFKPWKEELASRLREAQELGLMRAEVNPVIIVDQLVAMLFIGALRAETMKCLEYDAPTYLKSCVETILYAIQTPKVAGKRKKP